MTKYHLKQQRLDFLANWVSPHASLVDDEPEEPDLSGKKWEGIADVNLPLDDLLEKLAHEAHGLDGNVEVYPLR